MIFDAENNNCENDFIGLNWYYQTTESYINNNIEISSEIRISHRIFLLHNQNSQSNYRLQCDIKVCDRNDVFSDCNNWTSCLPSESRDDYLCDSMTCSDNESCEISNMLAHLVEVSCESENNEVEEDIVECSTDVYEMNPDEEDRRYSSVKGTSTGAVVSNYRKN